MDHLNRVAIGFLTKDRVELSTQTVRPLLQPDNFDLYWFDGSNTPEGKTLPVATSLEQHEHKIFMHHDVRGGPDAAVAYALTTMLKGSDYEFIGLVENDVLLHPDWFGPTMALFDRGLSEGLHVGAVSARTYEDRILIQRDGYAVCHNLGWGMQILTRQAARIALTHMRTGLTTENRRTFCQLSGIDIGKYWAFRGNEHQTCADWQSDRILASHGLASLALTPSPVTMIGQVPPLAEQGLTIADKPVELLRNDDAFETYVTRTRRIREGAWGAYLMATTMHNPSDGSFTFFPHWVQKIGAVYEGDWRLKWTMGFGPFSYKAAEDPHDLAGANLTIPLSGPVSFLVSGGQHGGEVELEDLDSGYTVRPKLDPETNGLLVALPVPANVAYRGIRLTMLTPGTIFYAIRTKEPQPWVPGYEFDWHKLPKV